MIFDNSSFQNLNQSEFINSLNQIPKNEVKNNIKQNVNKTNSITNKVNQNVKTNTSTNKTDQNVNKSKQTTKQNAINSSDTNRVTKTSLVTQNTWRVKIPSISLEAEIAEGTSNEVMNEFVGHFENTSKWNGNVALAAHNRGYPVNYFANIKSLRKGDIIEYYWNGEKRMYQVVIITKIKDTDWTYLASTNDNRITLITCVENEPEYRRCIQAVEI